VRPRIRDSIRLAEMDTRRGRAQRGGIRYRMNIRPRDRDWQGVARSGLPPPHGERRWRRFIRVPRLSPL